MSSKCLLYIGTHSSFRDSIINYLKFSRFVIANCVHCADVFIIISATITLLDR